MIPNVEVERIFHPTLKYEYAIINVESNEVLAQSDYYDYMELLLNSLKELHKGFMDTDKIIIGQRIVNKEATK